MNSVVICNIDDMPLQPRGTGARRLAQSFKFVLRSISDNDRRSFIQKRQAYSASQSTGTSGHQRKLPRISFAHCRLRF
jgi:hypothetical protein